MMFWACYKTGPGNWQKLNENINECTWVHSAQYKTINMSPIEITVSVNSSQYVDKQNVQVDIHGMLILWNHPSRWPPLRTEYVLTQAFIVIWPNRCYVPLTYKK